jgi:hypothetical protein
MLTLLFAILMIVIFGKMIRLALRAAWGLLKIFVNLICLPIILIVLVLAGLTYIALPILIIAGIIMMIKKAVS